MLSLEYAIYQSISPDQIPQPFGRPALPRTRRINARAFEAGWEAWLENHWRSDHQCFLGYSRSISAHGWLGSIYELYQPTLRKPIFEKSRSQKALAESCCDASRWWTRANAA